MPVSPTTHASVPDVRRSPRHEQKIKLAKDETRDGLRLNVVEPGTHPAQDGYAYPSVDFTIPAAQRGKRVILCLGAANNLPVVYGNGRGLPRAARAGSANGAVRSGRQAEPAHGLLRISTVPSACAARTGLAPGILTSAVTGAPPLATKPRSAPVLTSKT